MSCGNLTALMDARVAASLEEMRPALLGYEVEDAIDALTKYIDGASIDRVSRSTGIPRCRVEKWVKIAGVRRTDEEVKALQRRALDSVRHLATAASRRRFG